MGPVGLAGDDVLETVAIHVGELHGVGLAEDHAILVEGRAVPHDEMFHESLRSLLEPRQSEVVRSEARDDVAVSVAIDIVGVHLGSAPGGEGHLVMGPGRIAGHFGGLLEPAAFHQDVRPSVAVEVADPEAMAEAGGCRLRGDLVEGPLLERRTPVDGCVAEVTVPRADQLGLVVSDQIDEVRRLVGHPVEHFVLHPWLFEAVLAGTAIDMRGSAGKANREHVQPTIVVKVVGPREKVVGVAVAVLRRRLVDGVLFPEVRSAEPERAVHDVDRAVVVDVARVDPFGKVSVGQHHPLIAVQDVSGFRTSRFGGYDQDDRT